MKKILIALAYNPTTQKVAEKGYALGKAIGAEVYLLHVVAEPLYYSSTAYSPIMGFNGFAGLDLSGIDVLESLKQTSQEFLNQSKNHLYDKSIHTLIKGGDAAESILTTAKELSADVIVIGTHSRRWLEKIVMGSITEKVLNHSTVPLFVVPTKKE